MLKENQSQSSETAGTEPTWSHVSLVSFPQRKKALLLLHLRVLGLLVSVRDLFGGLLGGARGLLGGSAVLASELCRDLAAGEHVLEELGEHKRGRVELGGVVLEAEALGHGADGDLAGHGLDTGVGGGLAADDETDLAERVGGDLSGGVLNRLEHVHGADLSDEARDELHVLPHRLALRGDAAAGGERGGEVGVEGALEERSGGAHGVGGVGDDDIELALVLLGLDVDRSVAADELHLGVVPRRGNVGEVLLAAVDDHLVDLADVDLLDAVVAQDLADDAAVAAADDEHLLGVSVGEERDVRDRLLVRDLIEVGDLDDAVEDKDVAEGLGLEHDDVLFECAGLMLMKDIKERLKSKGHCC